MRKKSPTNASKAAKPTAAPRVSKRAAAEQLVPTVNLLSDWVLDGLRARRLRQVFQAVALLLVLLVLAGWSFLHMQVGEAEELVAAEVAETTRLTAETEALADVRTFVSTVEQRKALVQETMTSEVDFSNVVRDLGRIAPGGIELESVVVTMTPAATATEVAATEAAAGTGQATSCPGPDPFNTKIVVGCITLSGTADTRATVGEFVIRLGEGERFVEPFVSTTTTADGQGVVFSGSVGLSEQVFSNRYTDMARFLAQGAQR